MVQQQQSEFTWTLTPDVAGVKRAFDQNPGTYPKRTSAGLLSSKQYSNIGEGTWYFHVRFEDALGDWSDPVNFQVNIDLTPPLPFTVTARPGAGISGRTELHVQRNGYGFWHRPLRCHLRRRAILRPSRCRMSRTAYTPRRRSSPASISSRSAHSTRRAITRARTLNLPFRASRCRRSRISRRP